MPPGGAKDGEVMILTREDLVAAFRLWVSDCRDDLETVTEAIMRISQDADREVEYATACADHLIDYLIEAAIEPLPSDFP
jgi:hypothetical protein